MRFATPQGFNSGDQFLRLSQGLLRHALRRGRDRAENAVDRPSLPSCRPARPRGARSRDSSTTSASHDSVWMPTRLDIARHWVLRHPPPGGWKPSRLTRTLFVERFGGVYEHSPWVAATAWDAGLTASSDTAEGLAKSLAATAAEGSVQEQRALDRGPPRSGRQARARQDIDGRVRPASRRARGSTV